MIIVVVLYRDTANFTINEGQQINHFILRTTIEFTNTLGQMNHSLLT